MKMKKLLITVAAMIALFSRAHADVQISMQPGSQCWSYLGKDTRFYGSFLCRCEAVCIENLIRVDDVMESPKLAE